MERHDEVGPRTSLSGPPCCGLTLVRSKAPHRCFLVPPQTPCPLLWDAWRIERAKVQKLVG